jgi:hypothetical protein
MTCIHYNDKFPNNAHIVDKNSELKVLGLPVFLA